MQTIIPLLLQKIGRLIFSPIFHIFFNLKIEGKEFLSDLNGPVIIAANHTSELDPIALSLCFPIFSSIWPFYFVSNPKEKYRSFGWRRYFYGGAFFEMLGAYATHPGHKDYSFSLANHTKILRQNKTLVIFPEGKRTKDGNLSPARGGIGFLVHNNNAIVLPIVINTFFGLSLKEFLFKKREITLTICKPFKKEELFSKENPDVDDYHKAGEIILERISRNM